jgi:hypothetical protein
MILHRGVSNWLTGERLQSLHLAWLPRADGVFLTDNPQRLVQKGQIARVPFITGELHSRALHISSHKMLTWTGNCDDEGTLASFSTTNLTYAFSGFV